jgi:type II secretory pathway pseudopilin PulG
MKYFQKKQLQNGFTLLELILYMGMVTVFMSALIPFSWNVIEGGAKSATGQEIFTQGQYVADRITNEIRNASDINSVSPTQISLATAIPATNPTIISLNAGIINMQQGAATPIALNSVNTTIQSLTFTNYSSFDNKTQNIQFQFTIAAKYSGAGTRQEYNGSVAMEGSAEVRSN